MSSFPGSFRLLKGGIVLTDPDTSAVQRSIALQYNPDSLSRTLQTKGALGAGSFTCTSVTINSIRVMSSDHRLFRTTGNKIKAKR